MRRSAFLWLTLSACAHNVDDAASADADTGAYYDPYDGGGSGCELPPGWGQPGPDASAPPPVFGETVSATTAPRPISGGTLLATRDGNLFAADPDRDAVYVVDVKARELRADVALEAGDEPGRAVEDAAGRVHVVLRGSGAIATVDLVTTKIVARRAVCPAPRGIAFDTNKADLVVACAGGELVTLPVAGGPATRTLRLERDLRDVVLRGGKTFVSTLRSARLLEIVEGAEPKVQALWSSAGRPSVAYRTTSFEGGAIMVHQIAADRMLAPSHGGYGGTMPCSEPVLGGLTFFADGAMPQTFGLSATVLPVDVAFAPTTGALAVVTPANAKNGEPQLWLGNRSDLGGCSKLTGERVAGEIVAVTFLEPWTLAIQSREPATVQIGSSVITLSKVSRADTGHAIFHANAGPSIACASCHPEGGDDGLTWSLLGSGGPRRTQSLRGGVLANAPFHWDGSVPNLDVLLHTVFEQRMAGPTLAPAQRAAFAHFVDAIPSIPPSTASNEAAMRGKALFTDPALTCVSCHSGPRLTNGSIVSVGGSPLRVPSLLGVAFRGPWGHDGCATSLSQLFTGCSAGAHGKTAGLSAGALADLASYLETQ